MERTLNRFLQRLIVDFGLKKESIVEILESTKQKHVSFITSLIQTKNIESVDLAKLLADEFLLDFIDLDTIDALQLPINLIHQKLLQQYQILPLWRDKEKLSLAIVDPSNQSVIEDVRLHTGLKLEFVVVEEEKLNLILKKIINKSMIIKKRVDNNNLNISSSYQIKDIDLSYTSLSNIDDEEITIISYVHKLLVYAITRNASDVHIEPYQDHLEIRFRIDGLLY